MDHLRRAWLLAPACAWLTSGCTPRTAATPKPIDLTGVGYARDFRLQDTEGAWRTIADYRGKAVLVFFGFAQCPDVCPSAMFRAAEALAELGADASRVQVLFVTLDPERDSAEILRAFVGSFHPGFVALRGDPELTRKTADEFKVFYRKVPIGSSYTIDHSAMVYAYDGAGRIRVALRPTMTGHEQAEQLRALLGAS